MFGKKRMSTFDVNVDENMKEAYKYVTCPELKKRTLELKRYFDKAPLFQMIRRKEMQDVRKYLTYRHMD